MARSAVAVVVGFTRIPGLLEASFAPLVSLKRRGVLDRILYVTWSRSDLDPWIAAAAAMPEVELVRIPEPALSGQPYQKKHFYQTHNIAAALAMVDDDDALIIKLRPDQIIDEAFLASKIWGFDTVCAPSRLAQKIGERMPASPFKMKIWTPWADSNQFFFMEDGIIGGLRRDVAKLMTTKGDELVRRYGDANSAWIVHIARFIAPFLRDYPIFRKYLDNFTCYPQHDACRIAMLSAVSGDPFFWALVIVNAWILAVNFHVDAGLQGQISFYPTEDRAKKAGSGVPLLPFDSRPPYDYVERWRQGQKPGSVSENVSRLYGRLVDDSWQHAIFTRPMADFPIDHIRGILRCNTLYKQGAFAEIEEPYYRTIRRLRDSFFARAVSAA